MLTPQEMDGVLSRWSKVGSFTHPLIHSEVVMIGPEVLTVVGVVALLCIGGLVLVFVLPFLSGILTLLSGLLEFVFDVSTGGPVGCCGCLVFLILVVGCCGFVALVAYTLSTCCTPDAVNFCTWFGL